MADFEKSQVARDLGVELATQLTLCLNGLMNEPAFAAALTGYFDACDMASTAVTPSGKRIVNVDGVLNYLAFSLLLSRTHPSGPLDLFEYVLDRMYEWQAAHPSVHLHKAGAYYWAGLRDIEMDNVERGLLYMHQAVDEDAVSHERPMPPTPATWFVTMDPSDPHQAYHHRVVAYSAIVESYLLDYASHGLGAMTAADLRRRLQGPTMLNGAVALLHVVAQLSVMTDDRTKRVREHGFAALAYSQILLEIALAFEELVKPFVPANLKTLGSLLPNYSVPGSVAISTQDRDLASTAYNSNLDNALVGLLDSGGLPGVRPLAPQERDVLLLYAVRNASAHRLGRSRLFAVRFEDLARHLLFAVFHLIENKYP